ncbi:MAG: ChbG/HpnK family deacetylase [Bacteroidetes bacterium]|nr:ChbG/HpnK family deacetylase [Bacteroidota bacterium]
MNRDFRAALLLIMAVTGTLGAQTKERIPILLRFDDWGMSHSVNVAAKKVVEAGYPVSASIMFACPWYQEAVEIVKGEPHVSVGVHLTLNAEWKHYRWGPVAGRSAVPSLVDSLGFFFPSRAALFGNNPSLSEIETELRAQIDRAVRSGVRIDYLDYHMGAAVQTPETRSIVERLAAEYGLAVSRYFDEVDVESGYAVPVTNKLDSMVSRTKRLKPGGTKLYVIHVGMDDAELGAMEDLNVFGPKGMSKHRQSELDAVLSPQFLSVIRDPRFRLVNYRTMIDERSLQSMKRPAIE